MDGNEASGDDPAGSPHNEEKRCRVNPISFQPDHPCWRTNKGCCENPRLIQTKLNMDKRGCKGQKPQYCAVSQGDTLQVGGSVRRHKPAILAWFCAYTAAHGQGAFGGFLSMSPVINRAPR